MESTEAHRILDFAPIGMFWEVTKRTVETDGESFEAVNVLAPDFGGPPLHIHPEAEESYEVLSGTLDVCVGREWRRLGPGEAVTVKAGTPHTLRNTSGAEVRLRNVHSPAMDFERFFRRLHALVCHSGMKLPPRDLRSVLLVAMLFSDHPREIISVDPPRRLLRILAAVGKFLRFKLPD
ncbi:cupin domain-containing protein [Planctomyces sp. SH-PL62]|uniref:cupin domain-containing protein n=1 Tax=Planctomyces sp. SH-PL62 TaxID=1636152 RepID=UPI00078C2CAD|nr:cupin domain-containing protein [Planctomyces sp. SH-PL62]AMV35815.1 Cupin domain protein [Planctomyces sp. SH-PL62]